MGEEGSPWCGTQESSQWSQAWWLTGTMLMFGVEGRQSLWETRKWSRGFPLGNFYKVVQESQPLAKECNSLSSQSFSSDRSLTLLPHPWDDRHVPFFSGVDFAWVLGIWTQVAVLRQYPTFLSVAEIQYSDRKQLKGERVWLTVIGIESITMRKMWLQTEVAWWQLQESSWPHDINTQEAEWEQEVESCYTTLSSPWMTASSCKALPPKGSIWQQPTGDHYTNTWASGGHLSFKPQRVVTDLLNEPSSQP